MRRAGAQSGQAAVETAISMPLFLFLIFGTLQLGLAHQARLMTKYAAYKAARAGSIHNVSHDVMRYAAVGVLVPWIGREGSGGKIGKFDSVFKAADEGDYNNAWNEVSGKDKLNDVNYIDVTVCEPLSSRSAPGKGHDFDDPKYAMKTVDPGPGAWKEFNKTRIAVQVTFNYKLIIPFANAVLWYITRGTAEEQYVRTLRLGYKKTDEFMAAKTDARFGGQTSISQLDGQAKNGNYYLPIRASWSMRMQSNILEKYALPGTNKCHVGWKPKGE